jgi:hypothetical protein
MLFSLALASQSREALVTISTDTTFFAKGEKIIQIVPVQAYKSSTVLPLKSSFLA